MDMQKLNQARVSKMDKCKMCEKNTKMIVNINLRAMSLCNCCASSIMMQQAKWLANNNEVEE